MKPLLIAHPVSLSAPTLLYVAASLLAVVAGIILLALFVRRYFRRETTKSPEDWSGPAPNTENSSAFVTASMQGVIEKLRAQEKELARLHAVAQERARESERFTEEVTRNMPTGLVLVGATGAISSANPAAQEALGLPSMRYRSYSEILGQDSELARMLAACLQRGQTFRRAEIEHLTPQGEVRRLGVTISPIYRREGKPARTSAGAPDGEAGRRVSGALCLMSDLTELAALQKQMRWKENLASLGEMSAGIAHEFKNALATISGYAQMIRSEAAPDDVRDSAAHILEQTRALSHVVTEFLRFAKPLEISYETVPMRTLIERVAQELPESGSGCTIACEGDFADLPGDETLLYQVLVNLARNGLESARVAGIPPRITISGTVEELGGRMWQRICVADNGSGIPERELPKIFLPFYTTKTDGTGLGLAVVQKVALQHGGSIEARNRPDGGAEFLLWLPLRQEPAAVLFPSQPARI